MGRKRRSDRYLPERVYRRSGTFYFVEPGTNRWIRLGRRLPEVLAKYAELVGEPGRKISTVSALIDRYLKEIAPQKAESTYRGNLKEAVNLRAAFGRMPPWQVSARDVYAYLDERGITSKTRANREIALLSHMFKKAIRWGVVDENPCIGVERHKETPRTRYVSDIEYLAFRSFAGDPIAAYMDFKLLTGLRKGDILNIRLDQLQEDGVHVTVGKTGKRMIIEWSAELEAAVQRIRAVPRTVRGFHLFCTRRGAPYTVSGFSSIWQRKMKQALERGVLTERFTDHDLRRKTGSETDLQHAQRLLGHSDSKVTQRHYRAKPEVVRPLK